jgi:UDP-3-O-[3-hydroxymyristoyl] glucosamine N-acyltransferase
MACGGDCGKSKGRLSIQERWAMDDEAGAWRSFSPFERAMELRDQLKGIARDLDGAVVAHHGETLSFSKRENPDGSGSNFIEVGANVSARAVLGEGTIVLKGARVGFGVSVGRDSVIGRGTVIGDHTFIGDRNVLLEKITVRSDVTIGDGVKVDREAEIMDLAEIGDGAHIGFEVSVGTRARVGSGAILYYRSAVPYGGSVEAGASVESAMEGAKHDAMIEELFPGAEHVSRKWMC